MNETLKMLSESLKDINFEGLIIVLNDFSSTDQQIPKVPDLFDTTVPPKLQDEDSIQIQNMILSNLTGMKVDTLESQKISLFFKYLINELLVKENLTIRQIKECGEGFYSKVFEIGKYVIKFNKDFFAQRHTHDIPKHPRILESIFRSPIGKLEKENSRNPFNDPLGYVEVQEKVDTSNITDEDVYKVYKELRKAGIVWVDCKKDNLGRRIPSGELVIIDTDWLYYEKDFYDEYGEPKVDTLKWHKEMEKRYNEELNKTKNRTRSFFENIFSRS